MPDMARRAVDPDELASRLRGGNLAALARAISLVDSGSAAGQRVHAAVGRNRTAAQIVGFTGAPGAGKSSLINALIAELRRADRRVAVVAVDPSSPVTGGAVLGDRTRMSGHADDDGVFIRSVSGRGHLGGLSRSAEAIIDLLVAGGWPFVILETVGTGQSEIEVAQVADVNVVVNAPGLGDGIQAVKAGVLEIADILVVNKADLPRANQTVNDLHMMLKHRRRGVQDVPVLETVATDGKGIALLVETMDTLLGRVTPDSRNARLSTRMRTTLIDRAAETVREQLQEVGDSHMNALCEQVLDGRCSIDDAVRRLLHCVR